MKWKSFWKVFFIIDTTMATWHDMTWHDNRLYSIVIYSMFSPPFYSLILFLYNSIKTASLKTVFIFYYLICLYNNKFYKFVNYFKIVITTFTKLSLRAFPMRSNRILITMWLQPIVCSFHLALFFGLLTQGVATPCCQKKRFSLFGLLANGGL